MNHNEISAAIVDTAMQIHRQLGPGLFESVYLRITAHELRKRGMDVETEIAIPVIWDNLHFDIGFRADLIVEHRVIVEIKSIENIAAVHKKQLLTHLRLTDKRLGLLINFGAEVLKDGIVRIVNGLEESSLAEAQRKAGSKETEPWSMRRLSSLRRPSTT